MLGEGSMGKAYLVRSNQDQQLYVMKRINIGYLSPEQKEAAKREAQLHSIVSHPNIITFKEIYHTTKDKLCIIMEYAEGTLGITQAGTWTISCRQERGRLSLRTRF